SGPSMLVHSWTLLASRYCNFSSSSSEKLDTIVNSRRLPTCLLRSVAYSMMCLTTGQLTSGSPPWNSMVTNPLVLDSARSTDLVAVSIDMSVSTASMLAREAWQYTQVSLQRSVTTITCSSGPPCTKYLRALSRSDAACTS